MQVEKDIIKSFDEEVEKNQELQSAVEKTEDVNKSDEMEDTAETKKADEVETPKEEAEKADEVETPEEEAEKADEVETPEDKEEAEKADEENAEKSTDDEEAEEEEEADDEGKDEEKDEEHAEKSDVDLEGLLNVVIKSYAQLASQVSAIQNEVEAVKNSQTDISKSLDNIKMVSESRAKQLVDNISKSVDGTVIPEEAEGKAVGYLEKSSTIDDELEEVAKSANNVETAPVAEVSYTQVEELFKSKFTEATEKSSSARDENNLREIAKSWQRYTNDRATSEDTDRINSFINS